MRIFTNQQKVKNRSYLEEFAAITVSLGKDAWRVLRSADLIPTPSKTVAGIKIYGKAVQVAIVLRWDRRPYRTSTSRHSVA
jgi:hypothetical protein